MELKFKKYDAVYVVGRSTGTKYPGIVTDFWCKDDEIIYEVDLHTDLPIRLTFTTNDLEAR